MKILFMFILLSGIIPVSLTQQDRDSSVIQDSSVMAVPDKTAVEVDTVAEELMREGASVIARLDEFPTLHPVIVHFVIGLIIIAALLQLLNIALAKKDLAWIITFLLLAGFVAAILASRNFHPHTTGLTDRAGVVLGMHEDWAQWTIRTALVALVLQFVYLFVSGTRRESVMPHVRKTDPDMMVSVPPYKKHRGLILLIAVLMLASSYCVLRTGHHGAQLVHIEGVGPQGNYLEKQ